MAVMGAFGELYRIKEEIGDLIKGAGLPDVEVIAEFPSGERPYPLRRPLICVGLRSVLMAEGALGRLVGMGETGEMTGRQAEITLRLDVYIPKGHSQDIHAYFCALCDLMAAQLLDLREISCGEQSSTPQSDGFFLPCTAKLTAYVCGGSGGSDLDQIIIRRKEV